MYEWVLEKLTEIMEKYRIRDPCTIVTDRERALINALVIWFLKSKYILC